MKKLFLIYHTLKYVKPIQIKYRIWYRIKNIFLQINWYKKYDQSETNFLKIENYYSLVLSSKKYIGYNHFQFLNLKFKFENRVNWNFNGYGKLWNYNLQYFDYLLDDSILLEERITLLQDFSNQLLKNRIKLEPYPTSLRIINSILFVSKNGIKNELIEKAFKRQINYLENNLEYHLLANHLLENIYSLFISSFYLRDEILFKKANQLLAEQLKEQILEDGGHYECSPMYHSIILSKLLLCIEVAESQTFFKTDLETLKNYASKMSGWIQTYSFPDGSWALMNDAALGIAPTTNQLLEVSEKLNIEINKINLNASGYRKLKSIDFEVLVDVGNIIPKYQPGHAHADMLSFCLWHKGEQVIVDKGISTYNNNSHRLTERSTLSHNTVTINNCNQTDVWSSFRVGRRAKITVFEDNLNKISASHDGFKSKFGLIHKRTFEVTDNSLIISDDVLGHFNANEIKIFANYIFNESSVIKMINNQKLLVGNLIFFFEMGNVELKPFNYSIYFNKLIQSEQANCFFGNSHSTKLCIKFL